MIASKRLQYATNIDSGIAKTISGSDTSAPNTGVLRSISGLSFANASVRSFVVTVIVSIVRSSGGNLYETFTLEGNQKASSWDLFVTSLGDNTSTTFSITTAGQIQHTTSIIANWTSTAILYSGTQIVVNENVTKFTTSSSGSCIVSALQITDTRDSLTGVSNGALLVSGGASISKTLSALNINATGSITAGNLNVPTLTVTNINLTNQIQSGSSLIKAEVGTSNTIGSIITTGGNVGINTTSPVFGMNGLPSPTNLDVNGTLKVNDIFVASRLPSSLPALFPKAMAAYYRNGSGTIVVDRSYNCSLTLDTFPTVRVTFTNALSSAPIIVNALQRSADSDFLNCWGPSTTGFYIEFWSNDNYVTTHNIVSFIVY